MDYNNNVNTEGGIMPPASVASRRHKNADKNIFLKLISREKTEIEKKKKKKPALGKRR